MNHNKLRRLLVYPNTITLTDDGQVEEFNQACIRDGEASSDQELLALNRSSTRPSVHHGAETLTFVLLLRAIGADDLERRE